MAMRKRMKEEEELLDMGEGAFMRRKGGNAG